MKWLLYNLRYAMSTCLWGVPSNKYVQNTPCVTSRACGPFEPNIIHSELSPNESTYAYCANMPPSDSEARCTDCLHGLGSNVYLSNFFTTITAACIDPSKTSLSLSGSLFGTEYITVTEDNPFAPETPKVDDSGIEDEGPFSLGTKIGVAIGSICVALLIIGGILIICGRRRRRHVLEIQRRRNREIWTSGGISSPVLAHISPRHAPTLDTKFSVQSQSSFGGSPQSPSQAWSPYHSQYSSPISARAIPNSEKGGQGVWEWPLKSPGGTVRHAPSDGDLGCRGGVLGGGVGEAHELVRPRDQRERDEMDRRLAEEWAREVASKGFTVAPSVRVQEVPGMQHFPPPPRVASKK